MKLSAYIALLEAIRDSHGSEVDVVVADVSVEHGRGLRGIKEPPTPEVIPLLRDGVDGDKVFIATKTMFPEETKVAYQSAGRAVFIG